MSVAVVQGARELVLLLYRAMYQSAAPVEPGMIVRALGPKCIAVMLEVFFVTFRLFSHLLGIS